VAAQAFRPARPISHLGRPGPGRDGSRVVAEASGCLVAPPVFKTGERRTAALAGSIPVRLRHPAPVRHAELALEHGIAVRRASLDWTRSAVTALAELP